MPFLFQSQPSKDGEEGAKVGKWGVGEEGEREGAPFGRPHLTKQFTDT